MNFPSPSDRTPEQIFGAFLREQRLFRGISLEEIATSSKIPLYRLQALEEGRWDLFPAPVYLIGAIRSYAKTLGMIEEDVILRLKEMVPNATTYKLPQAHSRPKRRNFLLLFLLLLSGVIFGILLFWRGR
jgi:cytoskeletal protein RodZ